MVVGRFRGPSGSGLEVVGPGQGGWVAAFALVAEEIGSGSTGGKEEGRLEHVRASGQALPHHAGAVGDSGGEEEDEQ